MRSCNIAGSAASSHAGADKKIAAVVTAYYHNSHADVIVSRLFQTDTLDGKGRTYPLQLASLYTDQVPETDVSRRLSEQYGFPIYPTVEEALTLGTGRLAVDGVLLVTTHGVYPTSPIGKTLYPKRRMFEETVDVFEKSGRVVPIFLDREVANNWEDARWICDRCQAMNIPTMAGSVLPMVWRKPPADVERGGELDHIVANTYGSLNKYGFHALEFVQALAERRKGGETGIRAVQCLSNEQVWAAMEKPAYDPELFWMAMKVLSHGPADYDELREKVAAPVLFVLEYDDGLRAFIFTFPGVVGEWSGAWRYKDGRSDACLFWTQEARPLMHFTYQVNGLEEMFFTGRPSWPAERSLMTTGALDALLISNSRGGERIETPHLLFSYESDWDWQQPPPPPPGRPLKEQ